jgi:hypothetical protein
MLPDLSSLSLDSRSKDLRANELVARDGARASGSRTQHPSLTSCSINTTKRPREEDDRVYTGDIIDTFFEEYHRAHAEIEKFDLPGFSSSYDKLVDLRARLGAAEKVRKTAQQQADALLARYEYYRSQEGREARRNDPSLNITEEEKEESRKALKDFESTAKEQKSLVKQLNDEIKSVKDANKLKFKLQYHPTLLESIRAAGEAADTAERERQDIIKRSDFYKSEEGKAARKINPSLRMSESDKNEAIKTLRALEATVSEQRELVKTLELEQEMDNHRIDWLLYSVEQSRASYDSKKWADLDKGLPIAVLLWSKGEEDVKFPFELSVDPWDNRTFGLQGKWLQDLVFQRRLLKLLPKKGLKETVGHDGIRITFGDGVDGIAPLVTAISLLVAKHSVRRIYDGKSIASVPRPFGEPQRLLGWDVSLEVERMPDLLKVSFDHVQQQAVEASGNKRVVGTNARRELLLLRDLVERVVKRGGYTRKLAIVVNVGETGARGREAKRHKCIEFGIGGQKCARTTLVLGAIHQSSDMFKNTLYPKTVNVKNNSEGDIESFAKSSCSVAFIVWGQHARVIFKTSSSGCAIVDPHKTEDHVRPPVVVQKFLGGLEWIAREPEQCGESSCSVIAAARAVMISIAAHTRRNDASTVINAMKEAARSDILDTRLHGPLAVMLVRCVYSLVAPIDLPSLEEVFQT